MKKCETSVAALAAEIAKWLTSMGGSTIEALRRARREFLRRLKDAELHMVIELAERLLDVPRMDFRFVAYELIHHHRGALSELNAPQLERLGRGMACWGAVDCFGVYLAGPVWRERQVPNRLIHGRARAKDR